ncbi:MAG: hypothetical protein QN193_04540 [Armatimonadota bacterium]|nr:hypothetical protein [Armatimonadota bacterium]MDR7445069.1 hypothetical protein [Armatimonadota bacterium]MDR7569854.1 hypothetical protein [Armatimonadota bacterium]MDR7614155.1 hypothetical protein [Armatimonadota bacterium]
MRRKWGVGSSRIGPERGMALVVALITVMVLLLFTAALVTAAITETFTAQTAEDSARAFLVADAAAARALASLRLDANWAEADPGGRDAVGRCEGGVLYDLLGGECMRDVPYPRYGAIAASATAPPGGASEPVCAAKSVTSSAASPSPLPDAQSFGRYTVTVLGTSGPNEIRLRAVGTVGRASRGFEFTVHRVTPADFVSYSALRVDATRVGNGTFRIHGSVYVRGDWEFKGNSQQLNDRPVSTGDSEDPVYDNQTFVCGNLILQGNAQIGTPQKPMLGVHIAGERIDRGGAMEVYKLLQDKVVPDIRLANVFRATRCIRGLEDPTPQPPINEENCTREFPGLWDRYTNHLDASGSASRLVVLKPPGGSGSWVEDSTQTQNLTLGTQEWRIPKRGKVDACKNHSSGASLGDVLRHCAAYYYYDRNEAKGTLYVAAGQVIYIPGSLSVLRDVDYRVDDDPTQACNPAAGDSDPCRPDDGALLVVACESGTACNPNSASPAYGFDVREMLRAQRRASSGVFYPQTTFPTRDLLTVLVHGRVRFGLSGNPANQEINLVVLSGCEAGLPPERCDLTMQKNLQLYGSVISRLLVFEQNVDLYQVPDLRRYLPLTLDNFLAAPGGSAVVVTSWREIGF